MNRNKTRLFIINAVVILLLLLIFVVIPGTSIVAGKIPKGINVMEPRVQVKIPDGLYLYKPDFSKDAISPLVLVQNGKLVDPYTLAKEMGMPSFSKKYVTGKTFYAYVGSELYGKVSKLSPISDYGCHTEEFVPYIRWVGHFEGKPLPHGWLAEEKVEKRRHRIFSSTRAIFAPRLLKVPKAPSVFEVTEGDMERMVEVARKNFVPFVMEYFNKGLGKEDQGIIREEGSFLDVAEAFDLDANGKKDLVGVYSLTYSRKPSFVSSQEILFVLWDSEKVQRVPSQASSTACLIGGLIDIDMDGTQEMIVGTSVYNFEGADDGLQIDILRHGPSGWTSVYRPKWICGPSCADVYHFRDYGRPKDVPSRLDYY
jgi:hypothetical protein